MAKTLDSYSSDPGSIPGYAFFILSLSFSIFFPKILFVCAYSFLMVSPTKAHPQSFNLY
jgi:hypothetical protein